MKAILNLIQVQEECQKDSLITSCDLKLANILCGIQSHSSNHPCCWCDASSTNLQKCGHLRTFGEIRRQHSEFIRAEGDLRKSKDFKNVVHLPILDFPDEKLVLQPIPPMELHLLLGLVNHLIKTLFDLRLKAKEWPSSLHIPIQTFHSGHFNGNNCMKLLRGVSKLQLLLEKESFAQAHGFIQTLTVFKDVVTSCFGQNLDPDHNSKIAQFQQSYIKL